MVRTLRQGDIEPVMRIWLAANLAAHSFIDKSYWVGNFAAVKALLPRAEVYVWEAAGQIQGFVGAQGCYIAGIFVRAEARGQGVGAQLLAHLKAAKPMLALKVYQKNERAVRFYQKQGFLVCASGVDPDTGQAEYSMEWRPGGPLSR